MDIVLSKSTWPIIGWVCQILGWLDQLEFYFFVWKKFGISEHRYLRFILYTIIIYLVLTPLSDQAAEDVEDDERNAAGSAEN